MSIDIISILRKSIDDHKKQGEEHLSVGGAKNFEDYQRLVGRIEGLRIIDLEISDLLRRANKEN
jgi:hypothetical protein|tara:strand:- start:1183 stop:1374 length:192 start_codon:yes stop_codon:yes gene_type:complete